jgi:hypothetical protein
VQEKVPVVGKNELPPASNTRKLKSTLPPQGSVGRAENKEEEEHLPVVEEKKSKSTR